MPQLPMIAGLRREHRLLIACASTPLTPAGRKEIVALLQNVLDWPLVLQSARRQRVLALCNAVFQDLGTSFIPPNVMADSQAGARMTAARSLRLAAKLLEIDARAQALGVPLIPFKGPVLAEMAYGNLGMRDFVDLDFVIPHRELRKAWNLLEILRYRPANLSLAAKDAPIPGEYVFFSDKNDVGIEIHTELTLRHFPSAPPLEMLLAAREPVMILGRRVMTFAPEDTLALLAVHGAKDFWSQLLWISDVARLVQRPGFDWRRALDRAERMGCRRMVDLATLLANEVLAAEIPSDVLEDARADREVLTEAQWLRGRLFDNKPIGRWEQLRYRMRMVEGFWPGLRYAGRLATAPAADDWKAVQLPEPLGFAYALLRPLRLLRR